MVIVWCFFLFFFTCSGVNFIYWSTTAWTTTKTNLVHVHPKRWMKFKRLREGQSVCVCLVGKPQYSNQHRKKNRDTDEPSVHIFICSSFFLFLTSIHLAWYTMNWVRERELCFFFQKTKIWVNFFKKYIKQKSKKKELKTK